MSRPSNHGRAPIRSCGALSYHGVPDLDDALDGAELVLVHEWSSPELVSAVGRRRAHGGNFVLLFHDTHHRAVTAPGAIGGDILDGYDGVLAFGACLRERYLAAGWANRVWVWHEAADVSHFRPLSGATPNADLIWVGNWGDGERDRELRRFLVEPVAKLGLRAAVHGVRYPEAHAGGIGGRRHLPSWLARESSQCRRRSPSRG